jgi:hypothetical protein
LGRARFKPKKVVDSLILLAGTASKSIWDWASW